MNHVVCTLKVSKKSKKNWSAVTWRRDAMDAPPQMKSVPTTTSFLLEAPSCVRHVTPWFFLRGEMATLWRWLDEQQAVSFSLSIRPFHPLPSKIQPPQTNFHPVGNFSTEISKRFEFINYENATTHTCKLNSISAFGIRVSGAANVVCLCELADNKKKRSSCGFNTWLLIFCASNDASVIW